MANKHNYRQWGVILLFLVIMTVPLLVQAEAKSENLVPCGQSKREANGVLTIANPCDYNDFLELIKRVFDYLVLFAIPLAVAVISFGGFKMLTAGTNAGERTQANKMIWMAVWGLIIVLGSYLIVKMVFSFLVDPTVIPDNFK